jgi:DNA gyrase/topoisomerase IV subunit B
MTRNPKTLAVLPLRGMVLNTANSSLERVLENPELKSIVNVLGSGIHPFVKMGNRRYDKVIISTDGDSAGKMIAGLLLGFFAKFLPEWIELGKVFILVSPLYKQNGKFIYDNSELDTKKPFSRFKG